MTTSTPRRPDRLNWVNCTGKVLHIKQGGGLTRTFNPTGHIVIRQFTGRSRRDHPDDSLLLTTEEVVLYGLPIPHMDTCYILNEGPFLEARASGRQDVCTPIMADVKNPQLFGGLRITKHIRDLMTGRWLFRARTDAGISQRTLAEALGVHMVLVSSFERGTKSIADKHWPVLLTTLGVPAPQPGRHWHFRETP